VVFVMNNRMRIVMRFNVILLVLSVLFLQVTLATDYDCQKCGDNSGCVKACGQQTIFFTVIGISCLLIVTCTIISFCLIWSSPQIEDVDKYDIGTEERYATIWKNYNSECTRYDCGCMITTCCMIILLVGIIAFCGLYPEGGDQRWNNDLYRGIQIVVIFIGTLIVCLIGLSWSKRKNIKTPKINEAAFNDLHVPSVTEYQTKTVTEYRYVMPNGRIR
jgi:hypothetical protein